MKNDKSGNINYRSMIYTDCWEVIFNALTRLTTIAEDLEGEYVKELDKLSQLAEDLYEKGLPR